MTQGIGDRPLASPPLKTPVKPEARENQAQTGPQMPSLAQFALNQSLHRAATPQEAGQSYRSLSIFKDSDSGRFVTLFRDGESGQVTEQIPEERVLEFYARLEREMTQRFAGKPGDSLDVKA
jgi:hypothetical protein